MLFKKTVKNKKYPKEVLEIHNEFFTAADKILEEANSIINTTVIPPSNKMDLLKKLGFGKVKEVVEYDTNSKIVELSTEQIELVQYYKLHYPMNKFITEEQVKTICFKYNLVFGSVERFQGFVPQKNLEEIANFKLKNTEENIIIMSNIKPYNGNRDIEHPNIELRDAVIKSDDRGYWFLYHKDKLNINDRCFQSEDGKRFYSNDSKNNLGLQHMGSLHFDVNIGLQICAPVKDMNMEGMTITRGYKLQKHIPDPVVLQPVKGGYLILTAWGDEASDSIVVNENHN